MKNSFNQAGWHKTAIAMQPDDKDGLQP
jgi:hypothetical protein